MESALEAPRKRIFTALPRSSVSVDDVQQRRIAALRAEVREDQDVADAVRIEFERAGGGVGKRFADRPATAGRR